ncbi:MAG: hypothetical protein HXL57_01510 [Solobacterium sp.]|nr:hypothetical protein [Solobacterium sp.]
MNKVMRLVVLAIVVLGIGYGTYDFYQDCYGPDKGVVVQYVVQRGDTPIGISNKFASDRYDSGKVMRESLGYHGITECRVNDKIKVVTTLKRYEELKDIGENVTLVAE